jgi:GNAT superfamily N-acetyltransferase
MPDPGRSDLIGGRGLGEAFAMNESRPIASVQLRPIVRADREALARFYRDLSEDSGEARFLGAAPEIGDTTARFFCGPDHEHREGIVAEALDADGRKLIIGHICLEPISPGIAEMAIAVADAWQHHGLGRALLRRAIDWARVHGIDELSASMRCSNAPVMDLIRSTGLSVTFDAGEGGCVDARVDLRETRPRAA